MRMSLSVSTGRGYLESFLVKLENPAQGGLLSIFARSTILLFLPFVWHDHEHSIPISCLFVRVWSLVHRLLSCSSSGAGSFFPGSQASSSIVEFFSPNYSVVHRAL